MLVHKFIYEVDDIESARASLRQVGNGLYALAIISAIVTLAYLLLLPTEYAIDLLLTGPHQLVNNLALFGFLSVTDALVGGLVIAAAIKNHQSRSISIFNFIIAATAGLFIIYAMLDFKFVGPLSELFPSDVFENVLRNTIYATILIVVAVLSWQAIRASFAYHRLMNTKVKAKNFFIKLIVFLVYWLIAILILHFSTNGEYMYNAIYMKAFSTINLIVIYLCFTGKLPLTKGKPVAS